MELRERNVCMTELPSELVRWAEENGRRLTLVNKNVDVLSLEHVWERFPLNIKDLPDDLQATVRRRFRLTAEGELQRADCVVCEQPIAAWEEREALATQRRLAQESSDGWLKTVDDAVSSHGGRVHIDPELSTVPDASKNAVGGQDIAAILSGAVRKSTAGGKRG